MVISVGRYLNLINSFITCHNEYKQTQIFVRPIKVLTFAFSTWNNQSFVNEIVFKATKQHHWSS